MSFRTPIEFAVARFNSCDETSLPRLTDTLRILADTMDFSEKSTNGWTTLRDLGLGLFFPYRSLEMKFELVAWLIKLKCSDIRDHLLIRRTSLRSLLLKTFQPQARASGLFELLLILEEKACSNRYMGISLTRYFAPLCCRLKRNCCIRYSQDYLISAANGVFPYMPVSSRRQRRWLCTRPPLLMFGAAS